MLSAVVLNRFLRANTRSLETVTSVFCKIPNQNFLVILIKTYRLN